MFKIIVVVIIADDIAAVVDPYGQGALVLGGACIRIVESNVGVVIAVFVGAGDEAVRNTVGIGIVADDLTGIIDGGERGAAGGRRIVV